MSFKGLYEHRSFSFDQLPPRRVAKLIFRHSGQARRVASVFTATP